MNTAPQDSARPDYQELAEQLAKILETRPTVQLEFKAIEGIDDTTEILTLYRDQMLPDEGNTIADAILQTLLEVDRAHRDNTGKPPEIEILDAP